MPHLDELLGVATVATVGLIAAIAIVPVTTVAAVGEPAHVTASVADTPKLTCDTGREG